MTRPTSLHAGSKQSLALCIRRAPFWTPTITACWLSVALCTVVCSMPMLFALCLLIGVWQLVRSLTHKMVFIQAVTLCKPIFFFLVGVVTRSSARAWQNWQNEGKKPIRLGKGKLLPKQKNPPWKTTVWENGPRSQEHKLRVCLKNRQKKA
jgi:hypothetical protein